VEFEVHELPGTDALSMAPSCALDEAGLLLQLARYRQVGAGARLLEQSTRQLVVELDRHVDGELVEEVLAIERECCPFFELGWQPVRRVLTVAVSRAEHEQALDAIAFALDLKGASREQARQV
jgi:hypothetical protein